MKFSQLKFCILCYRIYADFTCMSGYVFQNHAKSRKYTCRVRRYDYTHYQLNTRHFNIIFLGIFIRGRKI